MEMIDAQYLLQLHHCDHQYSEVSDEVHHVSIPANTMPDIFLINSSSSIGFSPFIHFSSSNAAMHGFAVPEDFCQRIQLHVHQMTIDYIQVYS